MPEKREPAAAENPVLRCLSVRRRREILRALFKWEPFRTERHLAGYLAAVDRETWDPDERAIETVRADLVHVDLSALAAAGLVAWDRPGETVETADHPALEDPRLKRLLAVRTEGLDDALRGVCHERRRIALAALRDERAPPSRDELAREIGRRETGTDDPDSAVTEEIAASLHHAHLPMLDGAGLVEYDPETGRVSYADHPAVADVFAIMTRPEPRTDERLGGFLDGLHDAHRRTGRETGGSLDWAHFRGDPRSG